jgi:hypothetical protein
LSQRLSEAPSLVEGFTIFVYVFSCATSREGVHAFLQRINAKMVDPEDGSCYSVIFEAAFGEKVTPMPISSV